MELPNQETTAARAAGDSTALPVDQRLTGWRAYARQQRADILNTGMARLLEQSSGSGLSADALRQGLRRQLGTGLTHDLCQDFAEWRGEKAIAIEPEQLAIIDAAMVAGLGHLIPSDAHQVSTPDTGARLYRWLIPSLGGGLLLSGFGNDGALIGVAGGVSLVAWLANHPEALVYPTPTSGNAGASSKHFSAFPQLAWLQGPGHWFLHQAQGLARRLGSRLVALVLPPPPVTTATLPSSTIAPVCERAFDLLAVLVFISCVTQADSNTPANRDDADLQITEGSVLRALLALVRMLDREPAELETVRDLAEELHQRLEDAGYVWEVLPDGTPFEEEHRKRFHTFGLVASGEPVETLEPCFRHGNAILLPGRITKQRG